MHLAVTIKSDDDLEHVRPLIEAIRKVLSADHVTILEATKAFDYPYPFPVVTIVEGPGEGRHFGSDAIEVLRNLSKSA